MLSIVTAATNANNVCTHVIGRCFGSKSSRKLQIKPFVEQHCVVLDTIMPCLSLNVNRSGSGKAAGSEPGEQKASQVLCAGGRRGQTLSVEPPLWGLPIVPRPGFRNAEILHSHGGGPGRGGSAIGCQGLLQRTGRQRQPPRV